MSEDEKTVTQELLDAGYRHEKVGPSSSHAIIKLATGEVIGHMTAHAASEFLETLK